uniref:Putative structural protein n=1 Tax=viral metagenome TaxID=1070528 RepID=A0A6M3IHF9_9ZZZZ
MRSLSAFNLTKIDNPYVDVINLIVVELSGLTLYLCDRNFGSGATECVFNGQRYQPVIISIGNATHGALSPVTYKSEAGRFSFVTDNTVPIGAASCFSKLILFYSFYFVPVTWYQIFEGATSTDDLIVRFKGAIEDYSNMTRSIIEVTCSGPELSLSANFGRVIVDLDTYPGADLSDLGKMLPTVYGSARFVPFISIDAGSKTPLVGSIAIDAVTISLTDSSNFPSSGTVQIDLEQITYTGNTNNQLTGCTRGVNGTNAAVHTSNTEVVEVQSYYYYIIGHAVKAISIVYVDSVRQTGNYDAYTGQAGNNAPGGLYDGKACIRFNTLPIMDGKIVSRPVAADIDGYQDDGSGTYTGTPAALIERPDHVFKHILIDRCGKSADDIDSVSYTASGSSYGTKSYALTVVILSEPDVRDLLYDLAFQSKSIEFWESGTHHLKYIPEDESTDKTLDSRIDLNSVSIRLANRTNIKNEMSATYNRIWSEGFDQAVVKAISADSITKYGSLKADNITYSYISAMAQALDVIGWQQGNQKDVVVVLSFSGGYHLAEIEKGDILQFTFSDGDQLDKSFLGLVSTIGLFRVLDVEYIDDKILITFEIGTDGLSSTFGAIGINYTGKTYYKPISIELTSGVIDSEIYYTTDGSEPTRGSNLYTNPIPVTGGTFPGGNLRAKLYKKEKEKPSSYGGGGPYSFKVKTPVISPSSGSYTPGATVPVLMSCETEAAVIYYTLDETEPTEGSTLYVGEIPITETTIVIARAFKSAWVSSEIIAEIYTFICAWDSVTSAATIARSGSCIVAIVDLGGGGPYVWQVSGIGFWFDPEYTLTSIETSEISIMLYADDTACGTATITVTGCALVEEIIGSVDSDFVDSIAWNDAGSDDTIARSGSAAVAITGSNSPFTWSVSGTGYTLDYATTAGLTNTLRADAAACGTATVTVTGCDGNTATGYVRCTTGVWSAYTNGCIISGTPDSKVFLSNILTLTLVRDKYEQTQKIYSCAGGACNSMDCTTKPCDLTNCLSWECADTNQKPCQDWCCAHITSTCVYGQYCMGNSQLRWREWKCA